MCVDVKRHGVTETTRCRKLIFGRDIGRGLDVCNVMV